MRFFQAILLLIIAAAVVLGFALLVDWAFDLSAGYLQAVGQVSAVILGVVIVLFLVKGILFLQVDVEKIVNAKVQEILSAYVKELSEKKDTEKNAI